MTAHWKFGDGFAIRFGGYKDIQWYKGEGIPMDSVGIPPLHPAAVLMKVVEIGVQILQWWEMRKQTKIMEAQFEERRIGWIIEMMFHFSNELKHGSVRLDTVTYMERETARILEALISTERMDIPSIVLLQIERFTKGVMEVNRLFAEGLGGHKVNFLLNGVKAPFHYQPYWVVLSKAEEMDRYVKDLEAVTMMPFKAAAAFFVPAVGLAWAGVDRYRALREDAIRSRTDEFPYVQALAIELNSLGAQLNELYQSTPMILSYSVEDLENGGEGTLIQQSVEVEKAV